MIQPRELTRIVAWTVMLLLLGCVMAGCNGESEAMRSDNSTSTVASDPQPSTSTSTPHLSLLSTPQATPDPLTTATASATQPTKPPDPTGTPPLLEPDTIATPSATLSLGLPSDDAPVIVLDPGHDKTTPGALGIEYQEVLRTASYTKTALEAAGYRVFLTRTDNEMVFVDDLSLLPHNAADFHPGYNHAYAHASKALTYDPDLVIVLHYNGHPNPDVAGVEVYYCEYGGEQNLVLAEIVRDELVAALRSLGHEPPSARVLEDLTVARGNRHFPSLGNVYDFPTVFLGNRYAGIPVVLTEPFYLTNPIERPLIDDEATHLALADAYVRAVNRYFSR